MPTLRSLLGAACAMALGCTRFESTGEDPPSVDPDASADAAAGGGDANADAHAGDAGADASWQCPTLPHFCEKFTTWPAPDWTLHVSGNATFEISEQVFSSPPNGLFVSSTETSVGYRPRLSRPVTFPIEGLSCSLAFKGTSALPGLLDVLAIDGKIGGVEHELRLRVNRMGTSWVAELHVRQATDQKTLGSIAATVAHPIDDRFRRIGFRYGQGKFTLITEDAALALADPTPSFAQLSGGMNVWIGQFASAPATVNTAFFLDDVECHPE